uniref:Uncharacterized protein n=1 Tax=Physcomitrium patens TaxID=3218 RepID=A0A2K1L7K0_PHYPA|nr:hypothetical protein PHYPA_000385 [Physcomitrium patens]
MTMIGATAGGRAVLGDQARARCFGFRPSWICYAAVCSTIRVHDALPFAARFESIHVQGNCEAEIVVCNLS